ncbi:aspartate/glutamate/uridylate kinase family protein, partial [Striga asiatica]
MFGSLEENLDFVTGKVFGLICYFSGHHLDPIYGGLQLRRVTEVQIPEIGPPENRVFILRELEPKEDDGLQGVFGGGVLCSVRRGLSAGLAPAPPSVLVRCGGSGVSSRTA